jgi:hypothetical protein
MEKGDIFWQTGAIGSHIFMETGGIQGSNLSRKKRDRIRLFLNLTPSKSALAK